MSFSYGWGEKGEEGSSEDPGNIFYRGPKPFSEPETAALKVCFNDVISMSFAKSCAHFFYYFSASYWMNQQNSRCFYRSTAMVK